MMAKYKVITWLNQRKKSRSGKLLCTSSPWQ